ncbi:MAG: LLM class flavin-dependent oxidoreductase [Labilithrix sp.]|nr:LLM class flavin-dependent oxidoreductase [Labilithrix sp.]MCW5813210.1 LLM class flavin-dependent oxidoreductase [Labilithrix sp.]
MRSAISLSALDLVPLCTGGTSAQALASSVELARSLDRSGYTRLWYAEHHNMPGIATTTPEILIAHVAPQTERIRLGAGGVMLPNHSPLKVAEAYKLLAALHPGRIDLGLGRAPGTDGLTAIALRRSRAALGADDFVEQLDELTAWDAGDFPADHPFRAVRAMPDDVALPPIYLLGSSDYSAKLAAELGLPFAFAAHFSPDAPDAAMSLYRDRFRPSTTLAKPHAILALAVFCGDTEDTAKRMASSMQLTFAQLRTGKPGRMPSPDEVEAHAWTPAERSVVDFVNRLQIVGTPEQCRARILEVAERTRADEVMIATHAYDPAARIRSYELLAGAFGLREGTQP